MGYALQLGLQTDSSIFADFGYHLQLQCGSAPDQICKSGKGTIGVPFAGITGPHEILRLSILSTIDGMYQTMATTIAKLNPAPSKTRTVTVKFESKTGAFDPFEIIVTYMLVTATLSDLVLDMKHNVCLSIQAKFQGGATAEDLVLRLLDQAEACLGMCIVSPDTSDSTIVLHSDISSSELQLSMAGENSGVSWIPMRWGAPMAWIVPLESRGYILVTAHLMEGKGQSVIHILDATYSVDNQSIPNTLVHISPIFSLAGSEVATSSDVRGTGYPPGAEEIQCMIDGVKSAPVVSRSEVGRGPTKGAYVIANQPNICSTLLFSYEGIDGQMENSLQLCAMVLAIRPVDLDSSSGGDVFSPIVSVVGHSLLTIDQKSHQTSLLSRTLRGELIRKDGAKDIMATGEVCVRVHLAPLITRPPPPDPVVEPVIENVSDNVDPVTEDIASVNLELGLSEVTEIPLQSDVQILHDGEADQPDEGSIDYAVEVAENISTPGPEVVAVENPTDDDLSLDISRGIAAEPDNPESTSLHSAPEIRDIATDNSVRNSGSGTSFGSVGYPMNPRHVLSSSSVMTAGGTGNKTNSIGALVDTLTAELQVKQREIEKMSHDINMKQELYKRITEENQLLKNENGRIKLRIADAHTALARREQESEDASKYVQDLSGNPEAFNHWDREMLIHLLREAGVHIRRLETETQGLRETVAATEKIRAKYGTVCTQLSELQDAHLTQAKFLQKLKQRTSKVTSYEETIKAQEEVISRMQSVLEAQLSSKSSGRAPGLTLSQSLSRSLPGKRESDTANASDIEVSPTVKPPLFTEEDPKMKKELEDIKLANERLKNEIDIRNRRIESLEHQLISSAQEASKEISKLQTKLLDYELNHADTQLFGSNFDNTNIDANGGIDGGSGSNTDRMRQQLMVPFESMSNISFEQYSQKPYDGGGSAGVSGVLDEADDDDDDFLRYKKSLGIDSSSKSNFLQTGTTRRMQNEINNGSRPNSGVSRLESLVKPLGGSSSNHHISSDGFY